MPTPQPCEMEPEAELSDTEEEGGGRSSFICMTLTGKYYKPAAGAGQRGEVPTAESLLKKKSSKFTLYGAVCPFRKKANISKHDF